MIRIFFLIFVLIVLQLHYLYAEQEEVRGEDLEVLKRYPKAKRISFDYISEADEYYKDIHTIGQTYYIEYRALDNLDKVYEYYNRYFLLNDWDIILGEKTNSGDKWILRKIDNNNEYLAEINTSIYDEEVLDTKINYRITISRLPLSDSFCYEAGMNFDRDNVRDRLLVTGKVIIMNDFFNFNKTDLKECAKVFLKALGKVLIEAKGLLKILIYSDGVNPMNVDIDRTRLQATAIKDYMILIYPSLNNRIRAEGMAAGELLYDNETVAGRAKNRRIEFIIDKLKDN